MRTLSNRTRSEVATESIYRLCEANSIKRNSDRKSSDHINRMLEDEPNLAHSGLDVQLNVSSTHITVVARDKKQTIVQHEMPNVSFASSGDEETVDYVAYVAKNEKYGRACFVLECGYDNAKKVLNIIRRAFEMRTQQFLSNNGSPFKSDTSNTLEKFPNSYNGTNNYMKTDPRNLALKTPPSDATIRISSENQQNESIIARTRETLKREPWFHGGYLSREESETRLKQDGDFLVRESMLELGSFVLSVMNQGVKLHLLFDDYLTGGIKMQERTFRDISHLVTYHHENNCPISYENMIVYLRNGVRRHPSRT